MQNTEPSTPTNAVMTALTKRVLGFVSADAYWARQPISLRRALIASNFYSEFSSSLNKMTVFCPPNISFVCAVSSPWMRICF